jgi:hypothetical protein
MSAFDETSLWLQSWIYEFDGPLPIEGVEVCDDASGHCVETDSYGAFVLDGLTPQTETVITFRHAGYRPMLYPLVTPRFSTSLRFSSFLLSLALERERAEQVQQMLRDADRAEIDLSAERFESSAQIMLGAGSDLGWGFDNRIHVALDPPSGEGPVYLTFPDWDFAIDPPPSGEVAFAGQFFNVEPREEGYDLVFTRDSGSSCTYYGGAHGGWPSRTGRANAHHVPVREGYLTYFTQEFCASP